MFKGCAGKTYAWAEKKLKGYASNPYAQGISKAVEPFCMLGRHRGNESPSLLSASILHGGACRSIRSHTLHRLSAYRALQVKYGSLVTLYGSWLYTYLPGYHVT